MQRARHHAPIRFSSCPAMLPSDRRSGRRRLPVCSGEGANGSQRNHQERRAGGAAERRGGAQRGDSAAAEQEPASLDDILKPVSRDNTICPLSPQQLSKGGTIVAAGAVGTRRVGTDIPVGIDDRFHIGSDTKAMTALLAAMLVEEGKLRWDTPVAEIFPELAGTMAPQVGVDPPRSAPVAYQRHSRRQRRAGQAGDRTPTGQTELNLDEMRYWIIERLVTMPLQSPPGERFAYANMGYVLAGAIAERLYGSTWEQLVATRIFDPLGLENCRVRTAGDARPYRRAARASAAAGRHAESDAGRLRTATIPK